MTFARYVVGFLGFGVFGLLLAPAVERFWIVLVAAILNIILGVIAFLLVYDSLLLLGIVSLTSIAIFFGAVGTEIFLDRKGQKS